MSKSNQQIAPAEPSVAMMLNGLIQSVQKGETTPQTVEVMRGMMDLYERAEARKAEQAFAVAMVDLQAETIRVVATKAVDVKNGVPRYKFAPYEEIMAIVQPILTRHGFSVTFDTRIDGDRLISSCHLTHKGSHSRSNQFAVRFTTPPGASASQGDMSTKSYAKRGALCDALNITIDHDDDARMTSMKPICKAEAEDLRDRVKRCGADEVAFLKYAGATDYDSIPEDRYDSLIGFLDRKEAKMAEKNLNERADNDAQDFRDSLTEPEPKNEQGEYII